MPPYSAMAWAFPSRRASRRSKRRLPTLWNSFCRAGRAPAARLPCARLPMPSVSPSPLPSPLSLRWTACWKGTTARASRKPSTWPARCCALSDRARWLRPARRRSRSRPRPMDASCRTGSKWRRWGSSPRCVAPTACLPLSNSSPGCVCPPAPGNPSFCPRVWGIIPRGTWTSSRPRARFSSSARARPARPTHGSCCCPRTMRRSWLLSWASSVRPCSSSQCSTCSHVAAGSFLLICWRKFPVAWRLPESYERHSGSSSRLDSSRRIPLHRFARIFPVDLAPRRRTVPSAGRAVRACAWGARPLPSRSVPPRPRRTWRGAGRWRCRRHRKQRLALWHTARLGLTATAWSRAVASSLRMCWAASRWRIRCFPASRSPARPCVATSLKAWVRRSFRRLLSSTACAGSRIHRT